MTDTTYSPCSRCNYNFATTLNRCPSCGLSRPIITAEPPKSTREQAMIMAQRSLAGLADKSGSSGVPFGVSMFISAAIIYFLKGGFLVYLIAGPIIAIVITAIGGLLLASDSDKPDYVPYQMWTIPGSKDKTSAKILDFDDSFVYLSKFTDASKVTISINELSEEDAQYLADVRRLVSENIAKAETKQSLDSALSIREWKSTKDGHKFKAAYVRGEKDGIIVRRAEDNRLVKMPRDKLHSDDAQYIASLDMSIIQSQDKKADGA